MTKPLNLSDLARHLKNGGQLSASERDAVKARIASVTTDDDIHNLVRVFALSEWPTPENVALVAPLLSEKTEDYDLWGVILALCSYWHLTEQFIPQLLDLVSRPSWPHEFWQSGHSAFVEIGLHVHSTQSKSLLAQLIELFDEASLSNDVLEDWEKDGCLASAHEAIEIALNGSQAIVNYIDFKVPDDINLDLIQEAREKAA